MVKVSPNVLAACNAVPCYLRLDLLIRFARTQTSHFGVYGKCHKMVDRTWVQILSPNVIPFVVDRSLTHGGSSSSPASIISAICFFLFRIFRVDLFLVCTHILGGRSRFLLFLFRESDLLQHLSAGVGRFSLDGERLARRQLDLPSYNSVMITLM